MLERSQASPGRNTRRGGQGCGVCPWTVAAVLAAMCLLPGSALADSGRREAPREAVDLYQVGREHYEAGRYRKAIVALKAALELDPGSPNLVYNVARVNELLGNLDEAISYYERYLELLPAAQGEERERIEKTLQRLRGARTEVVSLATAEKSSLLDPGAAAPPTPLGVADALFWISAAAGVGLVAGGAVAGVMANRRELDVSEFVLGRDGALEDRDGLIQEADTLALAADGMFALGGAALVAAALLFFLREPKIESEDEVLGVRGGAHRGAGGVVVCASF